MYRSRQKQFFLAFILLFSWVGMTAHAGIYFEVGTSIGTLSNGHAYFGQSDADSTSTGFLSSLSIYAPITSERNFFHLELGLQNRFLSASTTAKVDPLAMGTTSPALRLQFNRFYIGGGYSPLTYVSKAGSGFGSLHLDGGASAYFFEGGIIWRIIPEFQIALTYSREFATPNGGSEHSSIAEYGVRFRFPLNPSAEVKNKGSSFDGFRYPFGFMK